MINFGYSKFKLDCSSYRYSSFSVLLELPVPVVQWTYLSRFEPSRNAMEMESVIAHSPRHCAVFVGLVALALDAGVHDVVTANSAVVDVNIPGPKSNCTPLFDLEDLVLSCSSTSKLA